MKLNSKFVLVRKCIEIFLAVLLKMYCH